MSAVVADATMDQAAALAGRLFDQTIGAVELGTAWLGVRLGLYPALEGGVTAGQLAQRTGIHERYAREWLESQAISGLVTVDEAALPADDRVYRLSEAQRMVLADPASPVYSGALPLVVVGLLGVAERVLDAFRTGSGVSFGEYGDDVRLGQALFNKPDFLTNLAGPWLEAVPDVAAALSRPGARALDLGTGTGWSAIALARALPELEVLGVDSDEASILDARANAVAEGVADRVTFEVATADAPRSPGSVDVGLFFECLHDMAHPVESLAAVRSALRPGGRVLVMDELAEEVFAPDGTPLERLFGACSVLHCLPVGMAEPGSAGTGTLFRPETMRRYAEAAGYSDVRIAPIEHDFMRFYVLTP